VHTLAGQRIEVSGQGGDQGLAFAGAHFGNLAVVQCHAADQLLVEMAHLEHALAGFAHHGKSFRQQVVQRFAVLVALFEFFRPGAQLLVAQGLHRGFQRIDAGDGFGILLDQPFIAAAENLFDQFGEHRKKHMTFTK
jgi:hypothetical protein